MSPTKSIIRAEKSNLAYSFDDSLLRLFGKNEFLELGAEVHDRCADVITIDLEIDHDTYILTVCCRNIENFKLYEVCEQCEQAIVDDIAKSIINFSQHFLADDNDN